ncbi:TPA: phage tail protein [Kluyvera georgiana]
MATSYSTNVFSAITLDCVNDIIGSIGEMQSSSLDTSNSDVVNALRILDRENRKVQSEGWTFNIQRSVRLAPDTFSKMIKFNAEYISMLEPNKQTSYVNRDGYVFDRVKNTSFFTSSITVDLICMLPLEEMPDCFIQLIVAR